ncbi:MAG TPA: GxxExxY protein [Gemmatimonadales bacterium]|nr:GxxExxY protein [Gemmatimonadales bacterium]
MVAGGPDLEALTHQVIGAGIEVHRHLGPGLLESAYQACLAVELRERRVPFRREVPLRANFRGISIDSAYRMDFVVQDRLLVEVKAVEQLGEIHRAQTLTYLRLSGLRLGLLLNFNVPRLADGIRRLVHHL